MTRIFANSPWGQKPNGPGKAFEEVLRDSQEKIRYIFQNKPAKGGGTGNFKNNSWALLRIIGIILLVIWLGSGFYIVQENQQAVVLRFGKFARVGAPGPNYHLPIPIESIIKQPVTLIQREEIGFRSSGAEGKVKKLPYESLMLTVDENILDVNFVVQWKIKDVYDYTFNLFMPRETVKATAEGAMREVVGKSNLSEVITDGRSRIEVQSAEMIQNTLDSYHSGIEIVSVQMLNVDPPTVEVINAFHDVQTAEQDKEKELNNAKAYRNKLIPQAQGDAVRMTEEAKAYQSQVIDRAIGETSRFRAVYSEYVKAKEVTRRRMYLETMDEVLKGMNKTIIDAKDSGAVPYLPLTAVK